MLQFQQSSDATIVHIHGNVRGSGEFSRLLAQATIGGGARVVLEFEACRSIDSGAMSAIAACRKVLGDDLRVVVPTRSRLRTYFKRWEHEEYLKLHADVTAACTKDAG